jgi:hypothetical protein
MTGTPPESIAPVEPNLLEVEVPPTEAELKEKFVKYAMRNMVKKGGKSLKHFFLSAFGLLALFVGLAYLTR